MRIESWMEPMPEPPELVVSMLIPNEVQRLLRLISNAYLIADLPNPSLMNINNFPQFVRNSLPISCLVWNVQGAGSRDFAAALKEVIRVNRPNVLALVETHIGGDRAQQISTIIGFSSHLRVDAQGFSGGIWIYWKPTEVTVSLISSSPQFINVEITRAEELPWFFSIVYASPDPSKRQDLWKDFQDFAQSHNKPWLIAGDFNETRYPWERSSSCDATNRRSIKFNEWIEDMCLVEVEFDGASHTWARGNSSATHQSARLDRALCNSEWASLYDQTCVKHLPAIQSDHCPLFISPNGFAALDVITKPFRFQAAWVTHESFENFVTESWDPNAPLVTMLKQLASKLQQWNKHQFHNIFREKRRLLARVEGIQKALVANKHNGLIKLESRLRADLDRVLEQEELHWYQKARVNWLRDGDRNTSFFHLSAVINKWRNTVTAIKDDQGNWVHDKSEVKDLFVNYFNNLFHEDGVMNDAYVPTDIFPEFSNVDWALLTRPFTNVEIDEVIHDMNSLKAPGLDGFQALFYQKNWELVKPNVYKVVLEALEGKGLPPNLNDTFLSLIPKVEHPELVSQFRPIGLCNVTYKMITKAIVNRIKPNMPHLTSNKQTSFVPGRQITDNIVIVQEVLHTMKHKKGGKGYMTIKIDFEKAYDRIRWDFLRSTLHEARLPSFS